MDDWTGSQRFWGKKVKAQGVWQQQSIDQMVMAMDAGTEIGIEEVKLRTVDDE